MGAAEGSPEGLLLVYLACFRSDVEPLVGSLCAGDLVDIARAAAAQQAWSVLVDACGNIHAGRRRLAFVRNAQAHHSTALAAVVAAEDSPIHLGGVSVSERESVAVGSVVAHHGAPLAAVEVQPVRLG